MGPSHGEGSRLGEKAELTNMAAGAGDNQPLAPSSHRPRQQRPEQQELRDTEPVVVEMGVACRPISKCMYDYEF